MDDQIPQLTPEQLEAGYDTHEPNVSAIAFFGVLIIIALVGIVLYVQSHWEGVRQEQVYTKVEGAQSVSLNDLRTKENLELMSKVELDRQNNKVKIDIQRAMELVAQESAAGKTFYPAKSYAVKPVEAATSSPSDGGATNGSAPAAGAAPAAAPGAATPGAAATPAATPAAAGHQPAAK